MQSERAVVGFVLGLPTSPDIEARTDLRVRDTPNVHHDVYKTREQAFCDTRAGAGGLDLP